MLAARGVRLRANTYFWGSGVAIGVFALLAIGRLSADDTKPGNSNGAGTSNSARLENEIQRLHEELASTEELFTRRPTTANCASRSAAAAPPTPKRRRLARRTRAAPTTPDRQKTRHRRLAIARQRAGPQMASRPRRPGRASRHARRLPRRTTHVGARSVSAADHRGCIIAPGPRRALFGTHRRRVTAAHVMGARPPPSSGLGDIAIVTGHGATAGSKEADLVDSAAALAAMKV